MSLPGWLNRLLRRFGFRLVRVVKTVSSVNVTLS